MKQHWHISWHLGIGALALVGASLAGAQTSQSLTPEVEAPAHRAASHQAVKPMHHSEGKKHHKAARSHKHRQSAGHPAVAPASNEYERNALRRCEMYKTAQEHAACAARVHQPAMSGSVESGGVLRQSAHAEPVVPVQRAHQKNMHKQHSHKKHPHAKHPHPHPQHSGQ